MILFIDTANVDDIKVASKWGVVKGVTTNPSLIAREGRNLKEVVSEITHLINGPISAEVKEATAEEMVKEAIPLSNINPNIVIKIPMTLEGITACAQLSKLGIKTNVTLVFSIPQAIMACEAGATYISPFMGRMDDAGFSGSELIEKMVTLIANYGYDTQIIAASIRTVKHLEEAALAGSDVATIPFNILKEMVIHPLTTKGLEIFAAAQKK